MKNMSWIEFEHDLRHDNSIYADKLRRNIIGILGIKLGLDTNEVFLDNCRRIAIESMFKLIEENPSKYSIGYVDFIYNL